MPPDVLFEKMLEVSVFFVGLVFLVYLEAFRAQALLAFLFQQADSQSGAETDDAEYGKQSKEQSRRCCQKHKGLVSGGDYHRRDQGSGSNDGVGIEGDRCESAHASWYGSQKSSRNCLSGRGVLE